MGQIRVAWWNLENLFDEENAIRDPELARTLKTELKGWDASVRDRKLDQLASIIRQMFEGAGPDLLGVCEVENEQVLSMLANRLNTGGRSYQVLGHESPDARGIDVSFIFDQNILSFSNPNHQVVIKRRGTRDLFWAMMTDKVTGTSFIAMANHWPARSGGQYESEPFRMLTGETVSYVLSKLPGNGSTVEPPVLLMGDFNDEPFNRSLQEYLQGSRDAERVAHTRSDRVLNLMWRLLSQEDPGTFRFESDWNMLDQFLVTRDFLKKDSPIKVKLESVAIFRAVEMKGSAGSPKPFGRPSKPESFDTDGFSDHYPITLLLESI